MYVNHVYIFIGGKICFDLEICLVINLLVLSSNNTKVNSHMLIESGFSVCSLQLRSLRDKVDEMETENNSLKKRVEKLRKREIH